MLYSAHLLFDQRREAWGCFLVRGVETGEVFPRVVWAG